MPSKKYMMKVYAPEEDYYNLIKLAEIFYEGKIKFITVTIEPDNVIPKEIQTPVENFLELAVAGLINLKYAKEPKDAFPKVM